MTGKCRFLQVPRTPHWVFGVKRFLLHPKDAVIFRLRCSSDVLFGARVDTSWRTIWHCKLIDRSRSWSVRTNWHSRGVHPRSTSVQDPLVSSFIALIAFLWQGDGNSFKFLENCSLGFRGEAIFASPQRRCHNPTLKADSRNGDLGVLRDSQKLKTQLQGSKHLDFRCFIYRWKGLEA
jgi:hypothetical protein